MEELLDLDARPYENAHPLVGFDEKSVERPADVRSPLPRRRAHAKRRDDEYQRGGTRNVFLFLEPQAGQRPTFVTLRRTQADWAKAMREVVDERYPTAARREVVLDHLNTHHDEAWIEIFGKAEAERSMSRVVFHDTPVHGRGLNRAEMEWSVMARPCTRRRWANAFTLATEWVAWEQPRQAACVTIRWKFTTRDARRGFARYYPDPAISSG